MTARATPRGGWPSRRTADDRVALGDQPADDRLVVLDMRSLLILSH
jgi:hypothetical protein